MEHVGGRRCAQSAAEANFLIHVKIQQVDKTGKWEHSKEWWDVKDVYQKCFIPQHLRQMLIMCSFTPLLICYLLENSALHWFGPGLGGDFA